jgi:hypothetical protein
VSRTPLARGLVQNVVPPVYARWSWCQEVTAEGAPWLTARGLLICVYKAVMRLLPLTVGYMPPVDLLGSR